MSDLSDENRSAASLAQARENFMLFGASSSHPRPVAVELNTLAPSADQRELAAVKIIAILFIFYTLYFAASLFIPIVCAMLLSIVLDPPVQKLERLRFPRAIAATIVVLASIGTVAVAATLLSGPAQIWLEKTPEVMRRLEHKIEPLTRRLQTLSQAGEKLQEGSDSTMEKGPQKVVIVRPALADIVIGTPHVLAPLLSVIMLMFLLLVAGDVFLRKLIGILPTFKEKKRTVEIVRAIEKDISYYLLTFASLNVGLGIAMGGVTALLGIPNAFLWGTLVAILNCVPYVGPTVAMGALTVAGFATFDDLPRALAAPGIMLLLAIFSAQVVAPILLGRGLRLNPVAIFIAIMLWGWLWGLVGVLLAVPLLASFKIVCERIESLAPLAEFLTLYTSPLEEE